MTSTQLDDDAHIQKRRMIDKVHIYVKRDLDLDDIQSSNKENIKYIKQSLKEMIDYSGNTTEYYPDGRIEITPKYLKPIPNEIIELIIDYLDDYHKTQDNHRLQQKDIYELSLVNKQFYFATNYSLWYTPYIYNADILQRFQRCLNSTQFPQQFTSGHKNGNHDIQHHLVTSRHHVRKLVLDGNHWDDVQFSLMMPHLNQLDELTITDVCDRISSSSILYFPRYFPRLNVLSLRIGNLAQNCIDAIAQHCRQLRELELPSNNLVSGTFKAFTDNDSCTTTLQSLRFYHVNSSQRRTGYDFITADMIKDLARFNCLTELAFKGVNCPTPLKLVFNATTSKGIAAWPSLSSLYIENGERMEESSFISFIKSHPCLRSIHLRIIHISDSTLDAMASHLPKLEELVMKHSYNITANAMYRLVQRCHNLEKTEFIDCPTLFSSAPELSNNKSHFTPAELAIIRERGDQ